MDVMTNKSASMNIQETTPFMYQYVLHFSNSFFDSSSIAIFLVFRLVARKIDPQWLESNTKLNYGVERIFTREGHYSAELLNEEGAFVDVPRAV